MPYKYQASNSDIDTDTFHLGLMYHQTPDLQVIVRFIVFLEIFLFKSRIEFR